MQAALLLLLSSVGLTAEDPRDPILQAWLAAHEELATWSADVVQTRSLASLTQPLVSTGRVHLARPDRFRWELGRPPETIAVRSTNTLVLMYPKLKRAEEYPISGNKTRSLGYALTLMEASFPKDIGSLRDRYNVSTESGADGTCRITLTPKSRKTRKLVEQVSLQFETNRFSLKQSEIEFGDGSRMRNEFQNAKRNEELSADLFSTRVPPDYKTVRPLNQP